MYKGIDVSDNQGVIDWAKVKASGVDFAILRSVRGSGKADYQFAQNVAGCRANGLDFDVYKYSYAKTIISAQKEAQQVVDLLKKHSVTDITVWWDMEDSSLRVLSRQVLTNLINVAKNVIEAAGFSFGIYCNVDWYNNVLDVSNYTVPFWVARYPSNDQMSVSENPNSTRKPTINSNHELFGWQYSSKGRVNGIVGNVDLNIIYSDITEEKTSTVITDVAAGNIYPVPTYTLYRGRLKQSKEYVKWLQVELGFVGNDVDGIFGKDTEKAFVEWQMRHPATYKTKYPDGKCGPLSRKLLQSE